MSTKCKNIIILLLLIGLNTLAFSNSYVNEQGQIIVDGKPFFMMGFFSDSYSSSYQQKIETIDSLSSAGFNTAKTSALGEDWEIESHFNHAEDLDFKLIYDGAQNNEWKDFHLSVMRNFRNKPGLLGWYIADDSHGIDPDTLHMLYERARNIDSSHITTHSMALSCWNDYGYDHIRERIEYCDVLQMQSYPIGKEPIDEVYHDMRKTLSAAKPYNTPVVVDLQLFNWKLTGHEWGRWPTAQEVKLMTWLAIVAGVDGYLYYTYYDKLANPDQSLAFSQPVLWQATKEIAKKVNRIKPVILKNIKFISFSPKSNCYYGQWITEEHSTIIVINTSKNDSLNLTIPIVEGHSELQVMFAGHDKNFYISDQFIKGNIAPWRIEFYRLYRGKKGDKSEDSPHEFEMKIYPNPSNNLLKLSFSLQSASKLKINIYSIRGRLIKSIDKDIQFPGQHTYSFSTGKLAAGVYILQTKLGNKTVTKKWTYLPL